MPIQNSLIRTPQLVHTLLILSVSLLVCSASQTPTVTSIGDDDCTASTFLNMTQCSGLRTVALNTTSNGTLFVTCDSGVLSVDPNSGGIITDLTPPNQCDDATALSYDATRNILYAACESGVVAISAPGVVRTLITSDDCGGATSLWADEQSGIVYAGCNMNGQGIVAALPNGKVEQIVTSQECSLPTSLAGAAGVLYAACGSSGVIAVADGSISTVLDGNTCYANVVKFDSQSNLLYASCWQSQVSLFSVDPASSVPTALLQTSTCQAVNFAVDSHPGIAYVSCAQTYYSLISLDLQSSVVTQISEVNQLDASGMTFDPSSNTLYYAESQEDLFSVRCPLQSAAALQSGLEVMAQ